MKKGKCILITLTLAFCFIIPSQAIDITWNGGVGQWDNPTNWTPAQVPGAGDNAIINTGSLTVSTEEYVNSLTVYAQASFTIDPAGDLTIHQSALNPYGLAFAFFCGGLGVVNHGRFSISQDPLTSSSLTNQLIHMEGSFVNNGSLYLDSETAEGIAVAFDDFTNNGLVQVEDCKIFLDVFETTATNNGKIYVLDCKEELIKISSSSPGKFINAAQSTFLNFDNSNTTNLIEIPSGAEFINSGFFKIYDGLAATCINNEGFMENRSGGYMSINGSFSILCKNAISGTLRNRSVIDFTNYNQSFAQAIDNSGFLVNHQSGNMRLEGKIDIFNKTGSEFFNYGLLYCENEDLNTQFTLLNQGLFVNRPKGKMYAAMQFINIGTITNQGHILSWHSGALHINAGTFNNNAALGDVNNKFPLFTNNGVKVRPFSGQVQVGSTVNNALELGSLNNVTILNWYDSPTGSTQVGSYNASTNAFTPNSNALGLTEIYVRIRINAGGQTRRHKILIPGGVQSFSPGSSSKHITSTNDGTSILTDATPEPSFTVFPQPSTGILNIKLSNLVEEDLSIELFSIDGKSMNRFTLPGGGLSHRIELPQSLSSGVYLMNLRTKSTFIGARRIVLTVR